MIDKIKKFLKKAINFMLNPRLLLCFGIGWMITNGWSYIFLAVGTWCHIRWMVAVAVAYLTILWFPLSPEKILTVAIAMGLMKLLFPNDTRTLGVLREMSAKLKAAFLLKKKEHKDKKDAKLKKKQNEK